MPVCTVSLLSLSVPLANFLSSLSSLSEVKPLVVSRVVRWVVLPKTHSVDSLLARNIHWDLLLILPGNAADDNDAVPPLPSSLRDKITFHWTIKTGIPSKQLQGFAARNNKLLHPEGGVVSQRAGTFKRLGSLSPSEGNDTTSQQQPSSSSSQNLEISPALAEWIDDFGDVGKEKHVKSRQGGSGPVSMLNLLAFREGMLDTYIQYGAEFKAHVGSKHGGDAKITGVVVDDGNGEGVSADSFSSSSSATASSANNKEKKKNAWDQVSLAHYPSIHHFADMLADPEYQKANQRYRLPALQDTLILCTSEVDFGETLGDGSASLSGSKL